MLDTNPKLDDVLKAQNVVCENLPNITLKYCAM